MKRTSLWQLFWTFFKIGAFTFGGGWSLIAVMEDEIVDKKQFPLAWDYLTTHRKSSDNRVKLRIELKRVSGICADYLWIDEVEYLKNIIDEISDTNKKAGAKYPKRW